MKVARKLLNWPVVLTCPVREIVAGRITQFREYAVATRLNRDGGNFVPAYNEGDVLFPREPWSRIVVLGSAPKVIFKDSWTPEDEAHRKAQGLPKIVWEDAETMPDSAARCHLHIDKVELQLLSQATEEDYALEGVQERPDGFYTDWGVGPLKTAREAHWAMWDAARIEAPGYLSSVHNPYTYVYRFLAVPAAVRV